MDFEVKMYLWILLLILKSGLVSSSCCYTYSAFSCSYCSGYCYGYTGNQYCWYYNYDYYDYSGHIGSLSIAAFVGLIIGCIIFFIFFVFVTVAICKSCTRSAGQHGRIVNPAGGVSVVQTGQQQGGPGGYGHPQFYSNVGYHPGYPPPQPMSAYGPPHPQPMTAPPPPPAYSESRPEVNQPPPVSTAFGGEPSTK